MRNHSFLWMLRFIIVIKYNHHNDKHKFKYINIPKILWHIFVGGGGAVAYRMDRNAESPTNQQELQRWSKDPRGIDNFYMLFEN